MGGGIQSSSSFTSSPDDHSSLEDDQSHCSSDGLGFDQLGNHESSSNKAPLVGNLRKRHEELPNVISNYISTRVAVESLNEAKRVVLSYKPGSWIDKEEGESLSDFNVPKTTTLLVVGFRGSGKSSLINRISRLFADDKLGSDRAQVSYGSGLGDGTCFLHGYKIPRRSGSFCLFDTRSLSDQLGDDDDLIRSWRTNGVRHGELAIRESDDPSLKAKLTCKIPYGSELDETVREVNSVIFVVDGQSILRCMKGDNEEATRHCQTLARTYNSPYFSFRDDKPTVVVTRGDLLIHEERARVRTYLGELLGVPPETQIFDIPENGDSITELAALKMLKYTLARADKNLPRKNNDRINPPSKTDIIFINLLFGGVGLIAVIALLMALTDSFKPRPTAGSNHLEPLVNRTHHLQESLDNCTRDYLAQIHYCNLQKHSPPSSTEAGPEPNNQTSNLDLQNLKSKPGSSQHPETQSKFDTDRPTKPKNPKVQSKPSQRKLPAKFKIRVKARTRKQRDAVEKEPTIRWEARQRLWFQE